MLGSKFIIWIVLVGQGVNSIYKFAPRVGEWLRGLRIGGYILFTYLNMN